MATFVTAQEVRDYLNVTGTTSNYTDGILGSNASFAGGLIQRRTNRLFQHSSNLTKVFSTRGRASMAIPDIHRVESVSWNGSDLTPDSTVYFIPDRLNTGVFVAVEIPALMGIGEDYRSFPEWFDRNYDSPRWRGRRSQTLPNDLTITGDWGHDPYPLELLRATTILAAWMTRRANALLANAAQDATGAILDYSAWPPEVTSFIHEWRIDASSGVETV